MTRLATILALTLTACSQPGFTTKNGVVFESGASWMSQEDAEAIEQITLDEFGMRPEWLAQLRVKAEWGQVDCQGTDCGGTLALKSDGSAVVVVGSGVCDGSAYYLHDLVHYTEWHHGSVDVGHTNRSVWSKEEQMETTFRWACF